MASKCSTAFVDPPVAATETIAFCSDGERDDLLGPNVPLEELHHGAAAIECHLRFLWIHRGNFIGAHGRNSQKGDGGGHGVCGELAAASTRAGTGAVFELLEFSSRSFFPRR